MLTTGLAFSGGKDSWACLWLNRERLDTILVIWVDTGKNYPEVLETIEQARAICPNFARVIVDREGQNAVNGIPSDVVPIAWTKVGQVTSGEKSVLIQSYIQCRFENITVNLMNFCKEHGITELICGQRNDEHHKSTSRNGDVVNGIKRIQPIETWSEEDITKFVGKYMPIPSHFQFKHSSMDCYDCTAFKKETKDIAAYRKAYLPELDEEYQKRNKALDIALLDAMDY